LLSIYADLDTECLRPYDTMFAKYNISTVSHIEATTAKLKPIEEDKSAYKESKTAEEAIEKATDKSNLLPNKPAYAKDERKVFLGRMGTDDDFDQSLPNAWMASTPGHPFWVLPLESCADHISSGLSPEGLTGPGALFNGVKEFKDEYDNGKGKKLDEYYAKSGWRHLYKIPTEKEVALPPQSIEVLPFFEIYPYSWHRDGQMFREVCWVSEPTFNAKKCKLLLGLEHWGSHSITYWSHSWSDSGHWDSHMDAINKPNMKNPDQNKDEGHATSENKKLEEEKERQEHAKEHELDERSIDSPSRGGRRRSVKAPGDYRGSTAKP